MNVLAIIFAHKRLQKIPYVSVWFMFIYFHFYCFAWHWCAKHVEDPSKRERVKKMCVSLWKNNGGLLVSSWLVCSCSENNDPTDGFLWVFLPSFLFHSFPVQHEWKYENLIKITQFFSLFPVYSACACVNWFHLLPRKKQYKSPHDMIPE